VDEAENRLHAQKALLDIPGLRARERLIRYARAIARFPIPSGTGVLACIVVNGSTVSANIVAGIAAAALGASAALAQAWPDKPIRFVMSAPAGSLDRRPRPHDRRQAEGSTGPARRGREQAGGRRHRRRWRNGEGRGRRLHDGDRIQRPAIDHAAVAEAALRRAEGALAVITTTSQPNVLAVNAQLPIKDVKELVAYRQSNPGSSTSRPVGPGSSSHLNGELPEVAGRRRHRAHPLQRLAAAVTSTVQGETQMIFAVMQPLQPQIQAGKLRATP
jgi:hypothetical protein